MVPQPALNSSLNVMCQCAGALIMAAGEYTRVANQKGTKLADVNKERQQLVAGSSGLCAPTLAQTFF